MILTGETLSPTQKKLRGISAVDGSTKAKIERAALTLFAAQGIDGVSTKQIAASAGISEGAIYRHFSGKEELARELMLAIHNRLVDMLEAARASAPDLASRIRFITQHYCRIADDDWPLFQYHILHIHHFAGLTENDLHSPLGVASLIIEDAIETEEIPGNDPRLLAAMALGVVLQAAQAKVFGFIDGPLSARTDIFTRKIMAVLELDQD